jgi:hypothetical protein
MKHTRNMSKGIISNIETAMKPMNKTGVQSRISELMKKNVVGNDVKSITNKSVALQALTNLGRPSSRRWQSFPTAPDGTGLTCGQHIESHSCIFSLPNRTVTSLFK